MNSKNLLTVTAVVLMGVAVSWVIMPDLLFSFFNITPSADLKYMAWRYAAYIIGLAVSLWLARGVANTAARRAILMGGFITLAITCALSTYAALTRSGMAWLIAGVELLMVVWFAYILFVKPEARSD